MAKKARSEEQILGALHQAESGERVADICHEHGVSEATFYVWKKEVRRGGTERNAGVGGTAGGGLQSETGGGRTFGGAAPSAGGRGKKSVKARPGRGIGRGG